MEATTELLIGLFSIALISVIMLSICGSVFAALRALSGSERYIAKQASPCTPLSKQFSNKANSKVLGC
jgi:hypothetical protein